MKAKIIAGVLSAGLLISGIVLLSTTDNDTPAKWVGTACVIGAGVVTVSYLAGTDTLEEKKQGEVKCRGCGKTREEKRGLALLYRGTEGLCRDCLDEYLPLGLKTQEKEEQK